MRLNDLSDGSIKTLLILGLLFANIAVAFSHRHNERVRFRESADRALRNELTFRRRLLKNLRKMLAPRDTCSARGHE